jgi:sulfonate transport system substrate-binding protein
VIHHALLVCRAGLVTPEDLRLAEPVARERPDVVVDPTPPRATTSGMLESPNDALEAALLRLFDEGGDDLYVRIEETVMRAAFSYCDRNQLQTARLLGISRNIVRARLLEAGEIGGGGRAGTPVPVALAPPAHDVVRVGYQQFGLLWLLRASGRLDRALASFDARVCWTEFPSGVELVEALSAGALDLGVVGEGPPLLAQALRAPLVYLAAEPPAPHGEAIVVRRDSTLRNVADLRGKRIVLSRGTNVHYMLMRALEEAGVPDDGVDVRFAPPAVGRDLFERGQADAWAVWDPWLASIEHGGDVRVLRDAAGLASNRAYYVAARAFSEAHAAIIDAFIAEVRGLGKMANENPEAVIELLGSGLGLEKAALLTALRRNRFGVRLFDAELAAGQQHVADSSHRHHLISRPVSIVEATWVQRPRGTVLSPG